MNCRTSVCGQLGHFYCPACDQKIVCGGFGGRVVPKRIWLCHGNGDTFMDRRNGSAEGTQRPVVLRITKMGKNQNTRNPEIMCWIVKHVGQVECEMNIRQMVDGWGKWVFPEGWQWGRESHKCRSQLDLEPPRVIRICSSEWPLVRGLDNPIANQGSPGIHQPTIN